MEPLGQPVGETTGAATATEERQVIVVGGGISGLSFAWHAARAGARPLVLEAAARPGGCLDSRRTEAGFWFELGAHTLYNSYGHVLEIAEGCAPPPQVVARGEARKRFGLLGAAGLATMGPLSVFGQFGWWSLLANAPRGLFASKAGRTTKEHFSRLVGAKNYREVLAPFLSAVPSQVVDDFPAAGPGSLFKKRPRRKDVIKSFTFDGGVGAVVDAIVRSGVEVTAAAEVVAIEPRSPGYLVRLADGRSFAAPIVAVAVDPSTAAAVVRAAAPVVAATLSRIKMVDIDSVGVVVKKAALALPELAFVVAKDDVFWSAVSRDPVPDGEWRAFTFHFRPGQGGAARRERIAEVLGVPTSAFEVVHERHTRLPSPARDHAALVAELDDELGRCPGLALVGNYFAGLSIEDCAARGKAEWIRLATARSERAPSGGTP
jgi:UDP-galactopyranose mutase